MLSRQDSRVYYASSGYRYTTAVFIAKVLDLREYQVRYSLKKLKRAGFMKSKSAVGWKQTNKDFYQHIQEHGCEDRWLQESLDEVSEYLAGNLNREKKESIWTKIYNKLFNGQTNNLDRG